MAMPMGHHHDPNDYGQRPMHESYARQGAHTTGPAEYNSRGARMQPTVRGDNRTMTAQRFKRRPPMWVVAALSCSIALLIAGVVIAIISTTSSPQPARQGATAATNGQAVPGPFTAARAAFNIVVTPAATTAPPAPQPTALAPAAPHPGSDPGPASSLAGTSATAQAAPPAPAANPPAAPAAGRPSNPPAAAPAAAPAPAAKKPAAAALGALTVVCMPKCDQIIDNGSPLGPGHIFNRPVAAGRHVLLLSAPNGVKKTVPVEVFPEVTREVRMSMDKSSP
jgi:hypothetical protein